MLISPTPRHSEYILNTATSSLTNNFGKVGEKSFLQHFKCSSMRKNIIEGLSWSTQSEYSWWKRFCWRKRSTQVIWSFPINSTICLDRFTFAEHSLFAQEYATLRPDPEDHRSYILIFSVVTFQKHNHSFPVSTRSLYIVLQLSHLLTCSPNLPKILNHNYPKRRSIIARRP